MPYKLNGKVLQLGVGFQDSNGASYPNTWLANATAEQKAAVPTGGITWEANPIHYDKRFYTDSKSNPRDLATCKADWVKNQKNEARNILADTDWLVLRAAEGGTAVPSDTKTYRAAVRAKSKEREDQINACSSIDDLASLIQAPLHTTGTATNGATEKKKEEGSSYDPKQWNSNGQNPDALKAWPTS